MDSKSQKFKLNWFGRYYHLEQLKVRDLDLADQISSSMSVSQRAESISKISGCSVDKLMKLKISKFEKVWKKFEHVVLESKGAREWMHNGITYHLVDFQRALVDEYVDMVILMMQPPKLHYFLACAFRPKGEEYHDTTCESRAEIFKDIPIATALLAVQEFDKHVKQLTRKYDQVFTNGKSKVKGDPINLAITSWNLFIVDLCEGEPTKIGAARKMMMEDALFWKQLCVIQSKKQKAKETTQNAMLNR